MSLLLALVGSTPPASVGGGYDYKVKKKRFIVEKDGQLLVFGSANAAINAVPQKVQEVEEVEAKQEVKPVEPIKIEEPIAQISISEIKQVLDIPRVDYLLTLKHLEALIAEYEYQREEQDIEELLLLI